MNLWSRVDNVILKSRSDVSWSKIRSLLPFCLANTPNFKGKGRITLVLDSFLTNSRDPRSYRVSGYLNEDIRFNFDLRPWGQKFAFYYRDWEGEYIHVLRRLYSGGVFVDVGSSLGLYAVSMGNEVRRLGGSIISIEPVPFNLERQRKNVTANHLDDLVTYIPCALGKEQTRVRIQTDPLEADNNAIITDEGDLEIIVRPLDDLASEGKWGRIGLIKMDVEGYEPMVIEGARATLQRDRPIILAEFLRERMDMNGFSMSNSWRFLVDELDYICYFVSGRRGKLRVLGSPGRAENLLFIPRDKLVPPDLL